MSLTGFCFCITGTLSVGRAAFEKFIIDNGGTCAKTVTKACTHLVSAETGTKKCEDAISKGLEIVDEDWVRSNVANNTKSNEANTKKKEIKVVKSAKPNVTKVKAGDGKKIVAAPTLKKGTGPLTGKCFCITGTLSVGRAAFEKFIIDNGGTCAKTVTKACTHLVSAETGTKKCEDAISKGLEIVDEDWVRTTCV